MDPDEKAWREKMAAMRAELAAETEALRAEPRAIQAETEARLARMDARMKSHEAKIEASNKMFFARKDYDRKMMEAPLEEEKPASVDMKPEAAQQEEVPVEDATVILDGEPEEEMTLITRREMTACQEEMEADAEKMEPDSEMMQSVVEHEEVPVQNATVMPVREPEEETMSITQIETMACQEIEARLEEKEPTSVDTKPEVAQQREVPVEDEVVKPVKGRKKQAAGRRGEPK
jgi:outer membrane translocation and assembly module TamA